MNTKDLWLVAVVGIVATAFALIWPATLVWIALR